MPIDFYFTPGSPPCRTVLLTASVLNIELNMKLADWAGKEDLKEEFVKLNPQHTVPTIVDDGFTLWESRAISRYLVNKYGADSTLYPQDPQARALVDQRLDFDIGTLYPKFSQYYFPLLFLGIPGKDDDLEKLKEALQFLNTFLEGRTYSAGDELTIADLSLVATVSTIDAAGHDLSEYSNIVKWYELVKTTAPGYEDANQKGVDLFKGFIALLKAKREE